LADVEIRIDTQEEIKQQTVKSTKNL